jgi:nitroreductase
VFSPRPIEDEKLLQLFEMTNSAPSAYNLQSYQVFVVKDGPKKEALSSACFDQSFMNQNFVAKAPVILVFCADSRRAGARYGDRGADLYALQDATIAATFAHLAAVDLGLSSVWVGAFKEKEVASLLGVSEARPVVILPLGYADAVPKASGRRPLKEVFVEA